MEFRLAPALLAATALGLAACSSNPDADQTAQGNEYPVLDQAAGSSGLTLTADQQQRRNALDLPSYQREYRTYYDQGPINVEASAPTGNATPTPMSSSSPSASGSMAMSNSSDMASGSGATSFGNTGTMSFAQLDRNGDGKLSVAEYAIYATGLNPSQPKPNDQTRPYATAEQLNTAADSFFHYDTNGDSYLQPDEFQMARNGTSPGNANGG